MSVSKINRGLLWGQLLSSLEAARFHLNQSCRGEMLLSDDDRTLLRGAIEVIGGIEQRAWLRQVEDGRAARPRRRRLRSRTTP